MFTIKSSVDGKVKFVEDYDFDMEGGKSLIPAIVRAEKFILEFHSDSFSVTELLQATEISEKTIREALSKLVNANLITARKDGKNTKITYSKVNIDEN